MPIDNSRDKDDIMKMMQGFPPAANHQVLLANWREPDIARWSFNHLRQLLPTAPMRPASPPTALATRVKIWTICLFWMRAAIARTLALF
jgi:hypothetical protein